MNLPSSDALHQYIAENLDRIYRFARNRSKNEYDAEDMTQDIILTSLRCIKNLRDTDKLEAWFWGVARNVHMKSFKSHSSNEIPSEDYALIQMCDSDSVRYSYVAKSPLDEYILKEEKEKIRRAVSSLSKVYRDVTVMYYIDEMDYRSIAEKLNIPLSSVKWRLSESKKIMKEEIEKMDYMNNGYRKAQTLVLNMGGYQRQRHNPYNNGDVVLKGLLAQNIVICAYDKSKTVTEIASELGVSADYIEDVIEKLIETQLLAQTSNKYQTAFPIFSKKDNERTFLENYRFAEKHADDIYDTLISIKDEIQSIGFHGSDKDFVSLIPMLINMLSHISNSSTMLFKRELLPFHGSSGDWYFLGTTESEFAPKEINIFGLSFSSYENLNITEYFGWSRKYPDRRSYKTTEVLLKILNNEEIDSENNSYEIAQLIEEQKIVKSSGSYKLNIPVLTSEEYKNLVKALEPVSKKYSDLIEKLLKKSTNTVKDILPEKIKKDAEFFGGCLCLGTVESALLNIFYKNNHELTRDMVAWHIYNSPEEPKKENYHYNQSPNEDNTDKL